MGSNACENPPKPLFRGVLREGIQGHKEENKDWLRRSSPEDLWNWSRHQSPASVGSSPNSSRNIPSKVSAHPGSQVFCDCFPSKWFCTNYFSRVVLHQKTKLKGNGWEAPCIRITLVHTGTRLQQCVQHFISLFLASCHQSCGTIFVDMIPCASTLQQKLDHWQVAVFNRHTWVKTCWYSMTV